MPVRSSRCWRSAPVRLRVTTSSTLGSTMSETSSENTIMTAVRTPNVTKIGMGAKAITLKPMIDDSAEMASAPPVPSPARRSAGKRLGSFSNSSRNRIVKWVE